MPFISLKSKSLNERYDKKLSNILFNFSFHRFFPFPAENLVQNRQGFHASETKYVQPEIIHQIFQEPNSCFLIYREMTDASKTYSEQGVKQFRTIPAEKIRMWPGSAREPAIPHIECLKVTTEIVLGEKAKKFSKLHQE